jgi:hypothetical protein
MLAYIGIGTKKKFVFVHQKDNPQKPPTKVLKTRVEM